MKIISSALITFVVLGLYGAQLGWGTDRDSLRVIGTATGIMHGYYQRSRSFGFPLHEAASAAAYAAGGLLAVNMASLAVTFGGVLAAMRVVAQLAPGRMPLCAVAVGFSPLVLVNAASAIDFGWDFAGGMGLLLAALAVHQNGASCGRLAPYGIATVCLILLRPDNGLFVAGVTMALIGPRSKLRMPVAATVLMAGMLAACVYVLLNGPGMFATAVTTTRPWPARLARATVFLSAAVGPGGALALFLLARPQAVPGPVALLRRATILVWLLYLPRFAALPDQADYLILPVELAIVTAMATLSNATARVATTLIVLPSLLTVSLFQRNPQNGALQFHPVPQWGALPQDWAARRFANGLAAPAVGSYLAAQLHGPLPPPIALAPDTYLPGFISPQHDLVIGRAELYHLVPSHTDAASLATVPRAWYRAIWVCADPLGPTIGWRGWESPAPATILSRQAAGAPEHCRLVDSRT